MRAAWKNTLMTSACRVGEKVLRSGPSGSSNPNTHQRDLYLKHPTPGIGFFLRTILLRKMRPAKARRSSCASWPFHTLTAFMPRMLFHSVRSDSWKPAASSGAARFMLNSSLRHATSVGASLVFPGSKA